MFWVLAGAAVGSAGAGFATGAEGAGLGAGLTVVVDLAAGLAVVVAALVVVGLAAGLAGALVCATTGLLTTAAAKKREVASAFMINSGLEQGFKIAQYNSILS